MVMEKKNCDCECKGIERYTPVTIYNPAGLSALAYRVGTHGRFKAQMIADISSEASLAKLTTRTDNDLTIALIDTWATIADVLSFYQERIANEGYLRTATERRSVLELARSISYELRPGVAANAFLAFTMEETAGSPATAVVARGTKVQSVPGQGELPKTFETVEEITARREWNMIPKQKERQNIFQALEMGRVYFEGTATKLKAGDGLLFVAGQEPIAFRIVRGVEVEAERGRTHVTFAALALHQDVINAARERIKNQPAVSTPRSTDVIDAHTNFTRNDLLAIMEHKWTEADLQAEAEIKGWSIDVIINAVNSEAEKEMDEATDGDGVYAFRTKCGIFGNSAPLWAALPVKQREKDDLEPGVHPPYPHDWDSQPVDVNTNYKRVSYGFGKSYLDNAFQGILQGSWLVMNNGVTVTIGDMMTTGVASSISANPDIGTPGYSHTEPESEEIPTPEVTAYKVNAANDQSMTGFSITAKVTGISLDSMAWQNIQTPNTTKGTLDLANFKFRNTSVFVISEKLQLSQVLPKTPVEGRSISTNRMVGWLQEGRPVTISGELEGMPDVRSSEIAFIESVMHDTVKGQTLISLTADLEHEYRVDNVELNANVAAATHGETKEESIGSGDPTRHFQKFPLKNNPLTHVTASTPTGTVDSLEVKIDGVEWQQADSFENAVGTDKVYLTRRSDDGTTNVIFGDGTTGRLPPSGVENIKAKYRTGLGTGGNVAEDKLSLLMKRPLGIKSVTNPLMASGGTDPEDLKDARINAPRTVLTMDRIVSLHDYKHFAQGFAGIGKATSYVVRKGDADVMLVAVASSTGEEVTESDMVYTELVNAIGLYSDTSSRFIVRSFKKRLFKVKAKILVSADREFADVAKTVSDELEEAFSFANRNFGQAVAMSEVMSVIQRVEEVEAADIDLLYDSEVGPREPPLPIIVAQPKLQDGIPVPSLLLVDTSGIELAEMASA